MVEKAHKILHTNSVVSENETAKTRILNYQPIQNSISVIEETIKKNIISTLFGILPHCKAQGLIVEDKMKKDYFVSLLEGVESQIYTVLFDIYTPKVVYDTKKPMIQDQLINLALLKTIDQILDIVLRGRE